MIANPYKTFNGQIQAVILDWAGTTIDYGSCAPVLAMIEAFRRQGVEITREEARLPMGMAKREHIASILGMPPVVKRWLDQHGNIPSVEDITKIYQDFLPLQLKLLSKSSALIPGCREAISACRDMGLKIGSTTGYTQELMDILVPSAAEQGYLPDAIVTATDVTPGRPAPWLCLEAARRLNVYPPQSIVVVDDTLVGIESGVNAGMWTIGIAQTGNLIGLTEAELLELPSERRDSLNKAASDSLRAAGANYVIDTIGSLPQAIDFINSLLSNR
jgi:phosphonoacetaldehyde hydrolase